MQCIFRYLFPNEGGDGSRGSGEKRRWRAESEGEARRGWIHASAHLQPASAGMTGGFGVRGRLWPSHAPLILRLSSARAAPPPPLLYIPRLLPTLRSLGIHHPSCSSTVAERASGDQRSTILALVSTSRIKGRDATYALVPKKGQSDTQSHVSGHSHLVFFIAFAFRR